MNGRTRKLGLAGLVIGGSLIFGVGFAGAQAPASDPAPKSVHVADADTGTAPTGYSPCGDQGEATPGFSASDL